MQSCRCFQKLVPLPAHSCPSSYTVPSSITRTHLLFQRKRPRNRSVLKLTLQRKILPKQMFVLVHKGAGSTGSFWKKAWLCLLVASINCLELIEERMCSQSNKFVNALDSKHVLTSTRYGCFLLQGRRDLLDALGRPMTPVVPTTAQCAEFSGVIESLASYNDIGQWFSVPTGKVGLVLSMEKRFKLIQEGLCIMLSFLSLPSWDILAHKMAFSCPTSVSPVL